MEQAFVFDHNSCVACGACRAACVLENRWSFIPRMIYTFNLKLLPGLPVSHLSLACNHCSNAVCMEGCPANAYHRDTATGAVVIDDNKCIGCRYCSWNCPWDAPKYICEEKVMGKCNLCHPRLAEGLTPACSTACPTGALQYLMIDELQADDKTTWFPEKNLEPALRLTGSEPKGPDIVPQGIYEQASDDTFGDTKQLAEHWSLITFSFLSVCSVSYLTSKLLEGKFPGLFPVLMLLLIAGLISLFHTGKKIRAWRAVLNSRYSPLSREISLFLLYSALSVAGVSLQLPWLLILASLAGWLLLLSIDAVYIYSDRRKRVFLHSGQTFFSAMLIVSFLTGRIYPFIFVAVLKLIAITIRILSSRFDAPGFEMRFLRLALLVIAGISMISGISYPGYPVIFLFLTGELLDRILFYNDFNPPSIRSLIKDNKLPEI